MFMKIVLSIYQQRMNIIFQVMLFLLCIRAVAIGVLICQQRLESGLVCVLLLNLHGHIPVFFYRNSITDLDDLTHLKVSLLLHDVFKFLAFNSSLFQHLKPRSAQSLRHDILFISRKHLFDFTQLI